MTGATKRRKKEKTDKLRRIKKRPGYREEIKNTYNKEGKVSEFL